MLITMILIHLNKLFEKSCSIDDYQKFIVTETISFPLLYLVPKKMWQHLLVKQQVEVKKF